VKDASHAWLVVDGWKYKELRRLPEATPREKPRLEVLGADGVWHKALALATPRGDKRAVVFDLSTVKWPEGRYHARLYTGTHEGGNAMWYLDRVRLTEEAPIVPAVDTLAARSADLQFVGAPSVEDEGNHAHALLSVDDGKGTLRSEQRTWGRFTRYGDVRELLGSGDDRMVVMRRGDGVELRFEGVRAPRAGALVTVMLETDLVFKPRTWLGEKRGTVVSERVEPMPYHGMSHYPPAKPFPDDEAHRAYMREWQTRSYEPGDTRWGP
jgi:hypothetical protein